MIKLAISTSAGQFALFLGENNKILFDSSSIEEIQELDYLLLQGLKIINKKIEDISEIIIDIGPGGTSRVRTGIAFANSLAYSLNISVCSVTSMKLACLDAALKYKVPVIFSVKSIKNNAYIGFYNNTNLFNNIEYGKIIEIIPKWIENIEEFVVVGAHREEIINLDICKNKNVIDSKMMFGNAKILIEKSNFFTETHLKFPEFALPVTEETL
ncbi:MAG: hypothetical protein LBV69_08510 [Bacteroidales bacterium]|jgi:tRNA threonylcarbamoyladenosine biosynthesis protein TsaB|nr:hypothetical protein [Bacteroidales bacterium]